jgi:hypothetical protein
MGRIKCHCNKAKACPTLTLENEIISRNHVSLDNVVVVNFSIQGNLGDL